MLLQKDITQLSSPCLRYVVLMPASTSCLISTLHVCMITILQTDNESAMFDEYCLNHAEVRDNINGSGGLISTQWLLCCAHTLPES